MKPTESEDNAGKDASFESDVTQLVSAESHDHAKVLHQTVNENSVKEGEIPDEKALDLSLKNGGEIVEGSHESLVSDVEWVCKSPDVSSTASGWPSFNNKPCSYPYPVEIDKASVAVLNLQHKAIEACEKFLVGDAGSDSDEDGDKDKIEDEDEDDNEDEDEDELVENYDFEETKEYKLFDRIFKDNGDLRRYYENNHKDGDFYCLVCGGIRKKAWKTFKNCTALLHHSTAILKTPRKRAHRAYAQVVGKLIGCDIDQLPAIVFKDLDSSLTASSKLLVEAEKLTVSSNDGPNGEPDNPVVDIDYKPFFMKEIAKVNRIKYGV